MTRTIVVGVDGSSGAAHYAAAIAVRRHATLTLVHVLETVFQGYGPVGLAGGYARPAAAPDGPVLVGFDGSDAANAALQFGVQEALSRKVPLVVANIYWEQPWGWHQQPATDPVITASHRAEQMLIDALELPAEGTTCATVGVVRDARAAVY
jgi:nucleotide-binding universal stress UspA family protein